MKTVNYKLLELSDFEKSIDINNNKLTLIEYKKSGRNNLHDVKWFTYSFNNDVNGYKAVNLMLFKIDEKTLNEAKKNILYEERSTKPTPNIDGVSGNIHPSHKYINDSLYYDTKENTYYEKISQLVLCKDDKNDPGPFNPNIINDDCFDFEPLVHKSCYFPRIDDKKPIDDWRYNLLKEIANSLPKEILSKEILDEINFKN